MAVIITGEITTISWSRDFSPVNDIPLQGTLGLKSKLQSLEKEVLSQSQRMGTREK
jgi:hypothetical protein